MQVTNEGLLVRAAYVAFPSNVAQQTAAAAEDYALAMAASLASDHWNVELHVDCDSTLGLMATCSGDQLSKQRARIWKRVQHFWPEPPRAIKVKAHATMADIANGVTALWEHRANALADTFANRGAALQ